MKETLGIFIGGLIVFLVLIGISWFINQESIREQPVEEKIEVDNTICITEEEHENYLKCPSPLSALEKLAELNWTEKEALEVADKVRASTICILPQSNASCGATGWIAKGGFVVTCGHCIHGHEGENETTYFWIKTIDGKVFPVERLEIHKDADLGIANVTTNASELPPPLSAGFASAGDPVLAVGNPSQIGTWVVVLGKILAVDGWGEGGYLADFPTRPGMSGSPAVNREGEVIGVVSGSTGGGIENMTDPYPLTIVMNFEQLSGKMATIESGTEMIKMIERYQP